MRHKTSIDLVSDKLKKIVSEAPIERSNNLLKTFKKHPRLLADTADILNEIGCRDFDYLGKGNFSLALQTNENYAIRIFNKNTEKIQRPLHPAILQPIKRINLRRGLSHLVIEILPKVQTEGVTANDITMVDEALYRSGISVCDLGIDGNVGLMPLKDGRKIPILIDAGFANQFMKPHDGTEHLKQWLAEDGTWLQKQFDRGTDSPSVIEKLDRLENCMRGPRTWIGDKYHSYTGRNLGKRRVSETMEAIKDGLQDEDIAKIYSRAMERLDDKLGAPTFSQLIKDERETLKSEMDTSRL